LNRGQNQTRGNGATDDGGRPVAESIANHRDLGATNDPAIERRGHLGLHKCSPEQIERHTCRLFFFLAMSANGPMAVKECGLARRSFPIGQFVKDVAEAAAA